MDKNLLRAQLLMEAADLLNEESYEELDESNSVDKYIDAYLKKYEMAEKFEQRGKNKNMLRPNSGLDEARKAENIKVRIPYYKQGLLNARNHYNNDDRRTLKDDMRKHYNKEDMDDMYNRIQARTKNPISGYKYPESKHGHLSSEVDKSSFKHGKQHDDEWI